jgi:hypothetical protein
MLRNPACAPDVDGRGNAEIRIASAPSSVHLGLGHLP